MPCRCRYRQLTFLVLLVLAESLVRGEIRPEGPALWLDFGKEEVAVTLVNGARRIEGKFGTALEFTNTLQCAEVEFSRKLGGVEATTVGGWFFPWRSGEQYLFCRGVPEIGAQGERFFRPADDWVNFVLGTDQHGFLLGTINGNGSMPFAHVTVNEVAFEAWNQLVVIKNRRGFQKFYLNGTLVHTDEQAVAAGNGPVSDFLHHGLHWAVPKGGGNSQSMPALRPYVLDHTLPLPVTFYEFTALIAPRPLLCGQAVGERRPREEENYAAVKQVYDALGCPERVRYHWYAGDHDCPPPSRPLSCGSAAGSPRSPVPERPRRAATSPRHPRARLIFVGAGIRPVILSDSEEPVPSKVEGIWAEHRNRR